MCRHLMNSFFTALLFAGALGCVSLASDTAAEIDRLAIENRSQIRSGHVTLQIDGESDGQPYSRRCETWFDGPRLRCDFTSGKGDEIRGVPPDGQVACSVTLTGQQLFRIDNRTPRDGGAYVIEVEEFRADGNKASLLECPIDPRLLGMVPLDITTASMHYALGDCIGAANASQHGVEESPQGVTVRHESDNTIREYVVIPGKGYAVERIGSRFKESVGNISDEAVSKLAAFGEGPVWFPREVAYTRHEGDIITCSENVRVIDAQLNVTLSPDLFTLAGMNPPAGRTVVSLSGSDPIVSKLGIWDGSVIQPIGYIYAPLASVERDYRRIALLVLTAIVTVWLAILVVGKRLRYSAR